MAEEIRQEFVSADGERHTLVIPASASDEERTKALLAWGWMQEQDKPES